MPRQILLLALSLLLWNSASFAAPTIAKPIVQSDQAWSFEEDIKIDPMNISGIVVTDQFMALATDEGNQLELFKQTNQQAWKTLKTLTLTDNEDEIDIEALAWQAPYLYALGSHSAKRKKIKSNLSQKDNIKRLQQTFLEPARQVLFRIEFDADLNMVSLHSLSLNKIITKHPVLSSFVGIPSKENGIDIEGMAIDHKGRLLLGFRGPVLRGNIASVLRVQLEKKAFKVKKSKVLYLHTQSRGIRGLTETQQGFLVLAGAVGDQPLTYQVYLWNGKNALAGKDHKPDSLTHLCDLPNTGGKPEGIQFIKSQSQSVEFAIVNDGLINGKPTLYRCPLP